MIKSPFDFFSIDDSVSILVVEGEQSFQFVQRRPIAGKMNHHEKVSEVDGAVVMFVKPAKCCSLEFLGFRSSENFFAQICEYFWSQSTVGAVLLEIRVEFLDSVDVLPTDIGYLCLQVGLMTILITHPTDERWMTLKQRGFSQF